MLTLLDGSEYTWEGVGIWLYLGIRLVGGEVGGVVGEVGDRKCLVVGVEWRVVVGSGEWAHFG